MARAWQPEDGPVRFMSFTFGDKQVTTMLAEMAQRGVTVLGIVNLKNHSSCNAGQQMLYDLQLAAYGLEKAVAWKGSMVLLSEV